MLYLYSMPHNGILFGSDLLYRPYMSVSQFAFMTYNKIITELDTLVSKNIYLIQIEY